MDDIQNKEMSAETMRRRELELNRIGAALRRIEEGEYGYCSNCGEKIGSKRIESDPSIATCIDCARRRTDL